MSSLVEGVHDSKVGTADTENRLIRIGSKYNSSVPAVSDGDNVYLLLDAAGRVIVTGPVASDGAALGSPVPVGGDVDDTAPAAAAEGDRRTFRSTPEGNQIVELYKDNLALLPIAAMPGASEVKVARLSGQNPSNTAGGTAGILATPSSGKRIRLLSLNMFSTSATQTRFEMFFGTGSDITADATKVIAYMSLQDGDQRSFVNTFPDGAGPLGAVDEKISTRTSSDIGANSAFLCFYREE